MGRDAEWAALVQAHRAAGPDGRAAVIEGEAGIGKTRLAEALLVHARDRGAPMLPAALPRGRGGPGLRARRPGAAGGAGLSGPAGWRRCRPTPGRRRTARARAGRGARRSAAVVAGGRARRGGPLPRRGLRGAPRRRRRRAGGPGRQDPAPPLRRRRPVGRRGDAGLLGYACRRLAGAGPAAPDLALPRDAAPAPRARRRGAAPGALVRPARPARRGEVAELVRAARPRTGRRELAERRLRGDRGPAVLPRRVPPPRGRAGPTTRRLDAARPGPARLCARRVERCGRAGAPGAGDRRGDRPLLRRSRRSGRRRAGAARRRRWRGSRSSSPAGSCARRRRASLRLRPREAARPGLRRDGLARRRLLHRRVAEPWPADRTAGPLALVAQPPAAGRRRRRRRRAYRAPPATRRARCRQRRRARAPRGRARARPPRPPAAAARAHRRPPDAPRRLRRRAASYETAAAHGDARPLSPDSSTSSAGAARRRGEWDLAEAALRGRARDAAATATPARRAHLPT